MFEMQTLVSFKAEPRLLVALLGALVNNDLYVILLPSHSILQLYGRKLSYSSPVLETIVESYSRNCGIA